MKTIKHYFDLGGSSVKLCTFERIAQKLTIFPFVCLPLNVYFLGVCSFQKPNDGLGYSHDTLCEREKYKDTVRHGSAVVTGMCLFYNITRL